MAVRRGCSDRGGGLRITLLAVVWWLTLLAQPDGEGPAPPLHPTVVRLSDEAHWCWTTGWSEEDQ